LAASYFVASRGRRKGKKSDLVPAAFIPMPKKGGGKKEKKGEATKGRKAN